MNFTGWMSYRRSSYSNKAAKSIYITVGEKPYYMELREVFYCQCKGTGCQWVQTNVLHLYSLHQWKNSFKNCGLQWTTNPSCLTVAQAHPSKGGFKIPTFPFQHFLTSESRIIVKSNLPDIGQDMEESNVMNMRSILLVT